MKLKYIKKHNANINEAISIINNVYLIPIPMEKFLWYSKRINEYNIKQCGLIKSVKDIFMPKKCFTKAYKKLIYEYNLLVMRYNVFNLEYTVNKEKEERGIYLINYFNKLQAKYKELYSSIEKNDAYNEFKFIAKKLDEQYKNLQATKTIYVNETRPEIVQRHHKTGFGTFGIENKTVRVAKEVPNKKKRNKAKVEIEKLEKQLKSFQNSKIYNNIYNLDKDIKSIGLIKQDLINFVKNIPNYEYQEDVNLGGIEDLKIIIETEKNIISKCYPKLDFNQFNKLDQIRVYDIKNSNELEKKYKLQEWKNKYKYYRNFFEQMTKELEL